MKLRKYIIAIASIVLFPTIACALNKQQAIYICGIATSFNDSTVYMTDIQMIENAWVDTKTGFLYSRDNYSYQLKDYLKKVGVSHPTCVTIFGKTRKEAEKKYMALKRRYTTKGKYDVKYIAADDFKYSVIVPNEDEQVKAKTKKSKESK